jgi:DNA-binding XRE family transcriptional regulator
MPMLRLVHPSAVGHVTKAQFALGMSQEKLADMLGVSRRTVSRWMAGHSTPSIEDLHTLARAVHPRDPSLAATLAQESGATLETLGLVSPATPPGPPAPPPRAMPPTRLMVDSIVCVAAESMQTTPGAIRDVLRAAFARALELGLSLEEVNQGLSPPAPPPEPAAPRRGTRGAGKQTARDP